MPELASDSNLGCRSKEGGVSRHREHLIGGFAVRRSECFVYREEWGSPSIPPPPIDERSDGECRWEWYPGHPRAELILGRISIPSLGGLGSIGFLGMENGSDGSP